MESIATVLDADDAAYVRAELVTLDQLARARGVAIGLARGWAGTRLPGATYVLPDGELRFARDWWELADAAGGPAAIDDVAAVRAVFARRLAAAGRALEHPLDPEETWAAFLAGLYGACLYTATPEAIVAKARLVDRIERAIAAPRPTDAGWRAELHADVDALDAMVRRFARCDRTRFGRPTSRDRLIDDVRARFERVG